MVQSVIIIALFALFYALKGGSGKTLFPWWEKFRASNVFTERLLDGKVISTIGVFIFGLFAQLETISINGGAFGVPEYTLDLHGAIFLAVAWLLAVAPSLGEEHGAIGRVGHAWGSYVTSPNVFGREYGVKKGLQRGVWMGACMALVTGFIPFICTSLLFVPAVFIGQEITFRLTGRDGWALSEPIIGAAVFGLGVALWLS